MASNGLHSDGTILSGTDSTSAALHNGYLNNTHQNGIAPKGTESDCDLTHLNNTSSIVTEPNGTESNGAKPNGTKPSGDLNTTHHNGTIPSFAESNGATLSGTEPNGAELNGPRINGDLNTTYHNGAIPNGIESKGIELNGDLNSTHHIGIEPNGAKLNSTEPDVIERIDLNARREEAAKRGIDATVMRYPETGINVLIAGAGLGGITCALECWRKGHNVRILDRSPGPVWTGDNVQIQPSAILLLRHWPEMGYEIERDQYDVIMSYYKQTGERIYGPAPPMFNDPENIVGRRGFPSVNAHSRIKLYRAFLRQAERVGLQIEWGCKVVEFWEDVRQGVGGVVLENGEKRTADIVVAADGLRTKSSTIVPGMDKELKRSGKAIYRAGYSVEHALSDPAVQKQWNFNPTERPIWQFWLGNGAHAMVALTKDLAFWSFIHSHDDSATESWVPDVDPSEVIAVMEREVPVHPAIAAFIKTAPKGSIVNWQLKFRDPHEDWTSPGGRVVQLGDAAHAFLPTSGNGATQAIEDGVTLATCLQLAGKAQAANGTKAYNKLRYQRVACAQKMGFVNQQLKQNTDWSIIAKNPALVRSRYPRWVWSHNPEAYAYEKFCEALHHVVSNGETDLINTNYPPGHVFKKWTMKEVQEQIKSGQSLEDLQDGDWS